MPTVERGQEYYLQKRVQKLFQLEDTYTGIVHGSYPYNVKIDTKRQNAECDCPAEYPCKHLIATVYAISSRKRSSDKNSGIKRQEGISHETGPEKHFAQELVLVIDGNYTCKIMQRNIKTNQFRPIKSITTSIKLPHHFVLEPRFFHRFGYLTQRHEHNFVEEDRQLKLLPRYFVDGKPMKFCGNIPVQHRLIKYPETQEEDKYYLESYYIIPETGKEEILKSHSFLEDSLNLGHMYFREANKPAQSATSEPSEFGKTDHYDYFMVQKSIAIMGTLARYQFNYVKLSIEDLVILQDQLEQVDIENLLDYLPRVFNHGPTTTLSIYPEEGKRLKIRGKWEFIYVSTKAVSENEERFSRVFAGKNSDKRLSRFEIVNKRARSTIQHEKSPNGNFATIDNIAEKQMIDALTGSPFFKGRKGGIVLTTSTARNFITEGATELKKLGVKIQIHQSLARLMSSENALNISFEINETSGIEWFDGQIEPGGMTLPELRDAMQAYRKKEDFIKLKDGNWVSLEMIGLKRLMDSFENLGIKIRTDGSVRKMTPGEALAISIERESDTRTTAAISLLKDRIRQLPETRKKSPENFDTTFRGSLRDYQKEGVLFLESLYETGIGGILADDMGLGKTIQGLAFLSRLAKQKREQNKRLLSLVVGPLASISVWKKEADKYFPDLPVRVWHGAGRAASEFPTEGVIITTYGTLLRDFESWKDHHHFDIAILDEAQNLKNFKSLSSHAVRQTSVSVYFCLTGTPLENHLSDLWALFDLSFPGYLGNRKAFSKYYQDAPLEGLRKKIEPFILRRTKSQVLKELPPITETLVPIAMTKHQRRFYDEARKIAMMELASAKENYLMVMLPHLTKLRRIACHPEVGNPNDAEFKNSGKFQYLKDTLPELEETSSGILIFSQYTDILKICARLLEELDLPYYYLEGKTTLSKREKMVDEFQAGEKSIFLISLKAGGTALTLHRADTVIHLDPWWNPATERQASDRAHRIGQKKNVFVYKLYSENSIEEKVLELQNQKKQIFDALFGEKIESTGKITRDQLTALLSD
ncbi:MAG: SNF2-related protein [Leptospirales bacterium]